MTKLKTNRLALRYPKEKDNKVIQFLRSDKTVNAYVERPRTNSLEEANQFIIDINRKILAEQLFYWCIIINDYPKVIGTICLWNFSKNRNLAEVGYDLHPKFHGQGIMSEALQCILEYGFLSLNLQYIEAFTHKNNEPSKRLLIKNNFHLMKNRKDENNNNNIIFSINKMIYTKTRLTK